MDINSVNYLLSRHRVREELTILGFAQCHNELLYHVCEKSDGLYYVLLDVFKEDTGEYFEGDRNNLDHCKTHPWVLMMVGIDNSSYYLRFSTKIDALSTGEMWIQNGVDVKFDELKFYNS
jgi:hypothetical protein